MSDTPNNNAAGGDEVIMAYADGVLPPDQRATISESLARDPELMRRFESFLFTRGPLARAFDKVIAGPIPERLLEVVRESGPPRPRPARSTRASSGLSRLADLLRMPAFAPAVAIPTVLVGVAAGWLAHFALGSDVVLLEDRSFIASASLRQALEQTPSDASANIVEGVSFKPTLTFASVQESWCRQYEFTFGAALRSDGLACRTSDGAWRVITLTEPERSVPPGTAGEIRPAERNDILEEMRGQLKRGDVLRREEVDGLIKEHWRTKP
jgi:surface antigen